MPWSGPHLSRDLALSTSHPVNRNQTAPTHPKARCHAAGGGDQAKAIVPFESARRSLNPWMRGVDLIVKPEPGVTTEEATDDVTALMRARRGLRSTQKNNFEIVTQDRLMGIYNQLFGTL